MTKEELEELKEAREQAKDKTLFHNNTRVFIVLAHNQIPKILKHIERLEAALELCKEQRDKAIESDSQNCGIGEERYAKIFINANNEIDLILKGEE